MMRRPPSRMAPLGEWKVLLETLRLCVQGDPFWEPRFSSPETFGVGLHLAILNDPYLGYILEGRKTVEARFGIRRSAPYQRVYSGDILLLKRASGPILGLCEVAETWFYSLTPASWDAIRELFMQPLCMDQSDFWLSRRNARFATLMRIGQVRALEPLVCDKSDRRGWVIIRPAQSKLFAG